MLHILKWSVHYLMLCYTYSAVVFQAGPISSLHGLARCTQG